MSAQQIILRLLILSFKDEESRNTTIFVIVFFVCLVIFLPAVIVCVILTPFESIAGSVLGFFASDELNALELLQTEYGYIQHASSGNVTHSSLIELSNEYPVEFNNEETWGSPTLTYWKNYNVTSGFGRRIDPVTSIPGTMHNGIDLDLSLGSPVTSVRSGTVIRIAYSDTGYGLQVAINHGNGFVTLYAHLKNVLISEGDIVTQGDIIAESGNTGKTTGPHLHFEVILNGVPYNPLEYIL